MIKRIIDIGQASYLHIQHQQLCIEQAGKQVGRIPIEDIAIIIIHDTASYYTHALFIELLRHNVAVVFCDRHHLPLGQLAPIASHSLHTKIIHEQIQVKKSTKKRLWKLIVQAKIREQATTLRLTGKDAQKISALVDQVKSGDSANVEANAARCYFNELFGNAFRRDRQQAGINALLNYGYSVVRAMFTRAIVATGLHPTFGIQHSNQYNHLCLADDLMEPFRPWVDEAVYALTHKNEVISVDKASKTTVLNLLSNNVVWTKKHQPFMVVSHYLAANLKQALVTNQPVFSIPQRVDKQ